MNIVVDARPTSSLSDFEIVAELFRAARDLELTSAQQVIRECRRMFPDLSDERRQACLLKLADLLS